MNTIKVQPAILVVLIVCLCSPDTTHCNPISFSPTMAPFVTIPPIPIAPPALLGSRFDPFGHMQATQHHFILPPSFGSTGFESARRSFSLPFKPVEKNTSNDENDLEQRALGDLPVSFLEPEGPSTVSERISDSFSALGEGVKNHFRSLSENFSDTVDDLRDAWRSSDSSSKRG